MHSRSNRTELSSRWKEMANLLIMIIIIYLYILGGQTCCFVGGTFIWNIPGIVFQVRRQSCKQSSTGVSKWSRNYWQIHSDNEDRLTSVIQLDQVEATLKQLWSGVFFHGERGQKCIYMYWSVNWEIRAVGLLAGRLPIRATRKPRLWAGY